MALSGLEGGCALPQRTIDDGLSIRRHAGAVSQGYAEIALRQRRHGHTAYHGDAPAYATIPDGHMAYGVPTEALRRELAQHRYRSVCSAVAGDSVG